MGVDLHWEEERGEIIESILDDHWLVAAIVAAHPNINQTACLRFIDPYGDTMFNQLQIPVFLNELMEVPEFMLSADALEHREKIANLAAKAIDEIGSHLKFYGE